LTKKFAFHEFWNIEKEALKAKNGNVSKALHIKWKIGKFASFI
jgi:hypothetical protein